MKRIACYPGSFDPITNGHVEVVLRGLKLFDEVVILVANNYGKKFYFTADERVKMAEDTFKRMLELKRQMDLLLNMLKN